MRITSRFLIVFLVSVFMMSHIFAEVLSGITRSHMEKNAAPFLCPGVLRTALGLGFIADKR